MGLDSSGCSDGERRVAVANALRSARFEVRERSSMEVADDGLEHRLRRLLQGGRPFESTSASQSLLLAGAERFLL